jgi:hypothetical protein
MAEHDASGDGGAKKNSARKKVSAVIGPARAKLDQALARPAIMWPPKGRPHEGVMPGNWKEQGPFDDTRLLPADCPVRPLGYDGENYYFVDTSGQVFNTGTSAMGVERVQKLFAGNEDFLNWAWPSWNRSGKIVTGFKAEEARRDLYAACRKRGPWTPTDRVRGRGAWLDESGRMILHCGEYLWIDGRLEQTGEFGEFFYVRRPASLLPWTEPVDLDTNPAIEIATLMRTWNFERGDVDVMLLMGWIGVALMGAALDWRPSVFIVGDYGQGKSELTGRTGLLRAVLGRAMLSTTNASEAGLYQIVGHDSLPIAIDELEGEDGIEQAQKIIKMARDAASGSIRIRGGQDHKGVEFQAQSTFIFSAVTPPPIPPASLSRLAILQLNPLNVSGDAPRLKAAETVGPRLLRRVADHYGDFIKLTGDYREVLKAHGHNSRGQKTFGTFLAAAHMLLGDEGMEKLRLPFEDLDFWGEALSADAVPELENAKPTWLDCLERMLTRPIDKFQGGQKTTPAAILEELLNGDMTAEAAINALAAVDIGIVPDGDGILLAIPNLSDVLVKHMLDTPYAQRGASSGSWSWALRRAPPEIAVKDKTRNRVTIAGLQRRCTLVRMRAVREWLKRFG